MISIGVYEEAPGDEPGAFVMAEVVGFEPTELLHPSVFKTAALSHSATLPDLVGREGICTFTALGVCFTDRWVHSYPAYPILAVPQGFEPWSPITDDMG